MTKLIRPLPSKRAYAVDRPDHLNSVTKVLSGQGTAEQRKTTRDKIANRYPGLKETAK